MDYGDIVLFVLWSGSYANQQNSFQSIIRLQAGG
jgi:hypothetical protein